MDTYKIFLFLFFGIFLMACNNDKNLDVFMVDSWQTTYLKIEMPTYKKSDSLEIYEDKFDKKTSLFAQSTYHADGTFSAWFINQKGEKIANSSGKWHTQGDSLNVHFFYNGKQMEIQYKITKTSEGFIGNSTYDWDEDGDLDDLLTMKTKRIQL